ncbi:histidine phosphatase family protein [Streptococcus sp. DD12]|uniref:histidine phosphatase family protein n=1 Tax=Streptococcus sp. DD12 TaxID=1777880 RepID=UPI000795DC0F|nr:histidine phosphatase family protein [Streptococcus sp. DD12]KXT76606.1 Phosphoglycerate mutase family [Streptococcus sp. DD12]
MKNLYLMRHGRTQFNEEGRVQGWCDSPLTEEGVAQALAVGAYFRQKGIVFDAVYSSTQERATDTAKLVTGWETVTQLKGLKEMNFGRFEAQPEYLLPKFRPGANSFEDALVFYGGDDIRDVGRRVKTCVDSILAKDPVDTILAVSHGAAMWGLLLELELTWHLGRGLSNGDICHFVATENGYELTEIIAPTEDFRIYPVKGGSVGG